MLCRLPTPECIRDELYCLLSREAPPFSQHDDKDVNKIWTKLLLSFFCKRAETIGLAANDCEKANLHVPCDTKHLLFWTERDQPIAAFAWQWNAENLDEQLLGALSSSAGQLKVFLTDIVADEAKIRGRLDDIICHLQGGGANDGSTDFMAVAFANARELGHPDAVAFASNVILHLESQWIPEAVKDQTL